MELAGKVVVVTGAAGGIGKALCRRFFEEGARQVVVSDLDPQATQAAASECGGLPIPCDVSSEAQVQSLVNQALAACGQIDLFVSNAGITVKGGIDAPDEDWQRLWNVNLMAHVYAARAVLPSMLERGDGYLLQVSSAAGILTEIGSAAYSVTKGAAVSLAEWLSVHYQKRGIKVSCLCPAGVATEFLDMEDPIHQFLHMTSVTPEHVADCVVKGLHEEQFLILTQPEVLEFFQFKTQNYDRWLKNFARVHQKLSRPAKTPQE
jgi:NAD(P)-dependent dehydrogenase (short-subunit alcohol dehydrogenase family)